MKTEPTLCPEACSLPCNSALERIQPRVVSFEEQV